MTERDPADPSISVVVTTYQSAGSITRALESVFNQTTPPLEILLCDDGSTDGTIALAQRFDGIRILSLEHSGIVGISRNRGVAAATGHWVAFLDADDEWTPEHLELFLETATSDGAPFALFCGDAERVTADGTRPFFQDRDRPRGGPIDVDALLRTRPVITSTVVADRSKVIEVGGFAEDKESVSAEDFVLWYRLNEAGLYFDPRVHCRYAEGSSGLTQKAGGYPSRSAAIHVLRELASSETDPQRRALIEQAVIRDELTRAGVAVQERRWGLAAASFKGGLQMGSGPVAAVTRRFLRNRSGRVARGALVLTVAASIIVAFLGLLRQKAVASIVGPPGLADLSLLLSIATPVSAFALWPLISFAKDLNDRSNELYERSLRSAAATSLLLYVAGATVLSIVAVTNDSLRFPLGSSAGYVASLLFALGMVGVGFATSVLTFRGDLAKWRRLALAVAGGQALVVTVLSITTGREGAVWGMAITTAMVGVTLLIRGLLRRAPGGFRVPERWVAFAGANAIVMVSLAAVEAGFRQVSADSSAQTAAFFQASISIIGAITAGVAQYTTGRLLPVATAARGTRTTGHVWVEVRRSALIVGSFVLVVGGAIAVLAPHILRIAFASEFDAASQLLRLVVLGECSIALSTVVTVTLLGLGRTALWAALSVLPALARIGSYVVLDDLSATAQLGWAYSFGGFLSVILCGAAYLWLTGRDRT